MAQRFIIAATVLGFVFGCGGNKPQSPEPKTPTAPETAPASLPVTSAVVPAKATPNVNVSDEIRKVCGIVDNVEQAPKFDFDSSQLSPQEKDVLGQVARCLTEGALKGKTIQLVGRADPRGEQEYNMNLGERRADTVQRYLQALGVGSSQLNITSRGELDATGRDEEGWRKDRRVDVNLVK